MKVAVDVSVRVVSEKRQSSLQVDGLILEVEEGRKDEVYFLTHSVKEELDEMKEIVVLSVRPEQILVQKIWL